MVYPGNRLTQATSPYLLQHAHNPVDWFPWGDEALHKAKVEAKPIFLSIGYTACHWCHVMERESFEDANIAAILNAHFVPIKVDREERPDLDELSDLLTPRIWDCHQFIVQAEVCAWVGGFGGVEDV